MGMIHARNTGTRAGAPGRRRHRGLFVFALGVLLMIAGALVMGDAGGLIQYILPAPAATQEGGELGALYEDGQKQLAGMADSFTAYAIGARAQGVSLSMEEGQYVQAALYAVGEGYFDVLHETLVSGRYISVADVRREERAIVIDEGAALTLFAGDDPIGREVLLDGRPYEVAGVIKGGRRLGEADEHIAYMPITTASRDAVDMQTVEFTARAASAIASGILMEDTLSSWKRGGSFYSMDKLAQGAVMPLRWVILIGGTFVLLSLLARLNAVAWGRICYYADQLKTRYARDMKGGIAASVLLCLLGYALLGGAAFLLAAFSIQPLYVFTEWVPEVIVELSSLSSRFWALNDQNAAAIRCVSSVVCRMELGQGLFRWGMTAALLGAFLHGIPWLNRRVIMPRMNRAH